MSGHRWHRGRRAGHLETSAHGSACRSLALARQNLRAAAQWPSSSCHPWKSVPAGWLNNVAQSPAFASPQLLTRRDRDNPAAPFPVDGGFAALESACVDTGTCPPSKVCRCPSPQTRRWQILPSRAAVSQSTFPTSYMAFHYCIVDTS